MTPGRMVLLLALLVTAGGLTFLLRAPEGAGRDLPTADDGQQASDGRATLVGRAAATHDARSGDSASKLDATLAPDAWRLSGRFVTADGDGPVPAAQVRAWWVEGLRSELLTEGVSDRQGAFLLPLPALASVSEARRAAGELEVHAKARGFGPPRGTKRETVHNVVRLRATSRELTCTLRLIPGPTLSGSLVRADGGQLVDARVRVVYENPKLAWKTLAQTRAQPDSRFTLVVPDGEPVVLESHVPGFGRTRHGPFTAAGGPMDVGRLVVSPPATIEGLVVDGVGRPRAEVLVVGRRQVSSPPPVAWSLLPGGADDWNREVSIARSDARGRFVLPAAEPGARWTLAVSAQTPQRHLPGQVLPGWHPFPRDAKEPGLLGGSTAREAVAGERDVLLQVQGTRLGVRVVDSAGTPIPGAEVALLGWPGARPRLPHGEAAPPRERLIVESNEQGRASTWVRLESHWLAEAVLGRARGAAEVDVFEGDWERDLETTVPEPGALATLELRIDGGGGAALEKVALRILTPGGRELLHREVSVDATLDVPPGPCRVHVEASPRSSSPFSLLDAGPIPRDQARRLPLCPHVEDLELEPGRRHVLRATLERMAQLHVLLPPGNDADPDVGPPEVVVAVQIGARDEQPLFIPVRTGLPTWTVTLPPGAVRVLVRTSWPSAAPPGKPAETEVHDLVLSAGEVQTLDHRAGRLPR